MARAIIGQIAFDIVNAPMPENSGKLDMMYENAEKYVADYWLGNPSSEDRAAIDAFAARLIAQRRDHAIAEQIARDLKAAHNAACADIVALNARVAELESANRPTPEDLGMVDDEPETDSSGEEKAEETESEPENADGV